MLAFSPPFGVLSNDWRGVNWDAMIAAIGNNHTNDTKF